MRINVAQPHPELGVQVLRVGALRGQVLRLRVLRIRVLRLRVHGRNYRFSVQIMLEYNAQQAGRQHRPHQDVPR